MVEGRKTVTVVFTDVRGSTSLGEKLDAEALRRVMERYFGEMRSILEHHGGTVEKFIGDAVMAAFGIPAVHEDDALRAVRAAADMRERLAELNEDLERERGVTLEVRTGINTGEVVAGDPSGGQFYATGDAVNVAARLEQAARPGEVLLGEQTYRLVRDAVEVRAVEPRALKGKAQPVPAYCLLGVIEGAPALARRFETPFVGRERELGRLAASFERSVAEGIPLLVTVLGPAGIGKTRLAGELAAKTRQRATVLQGRCLSYGEGITFWPLEEMLRGLAERPAGAPDPEQAHSIEETFWAYRKLFEELAQERPLLLVLEDIHWAEQTLLDLIEHIVDWTREARLLILCLARREFLDQRPNWPGERLELEPLHEDEASTLVSALAPELDPVSRARAAEAAEGNPFFLEQLLTLAAEDGHELAIPHTIQALLAARLDRLEANERALLERAAVVGKEFWRGALLHLSPPETQVSALLQGLVRKRLIRPGRSTLASEDAFLFGHILIRDATYQGIAKEVRARLHERFANWLEARESPYIEIVGYHLEQAYRHRAELGPIDEALRALGNHASDVLERAGNALLYRDDRAAVNLLERASSLQSDHSKGLTLSVRLAEALKNGGHLEQARTLLSSVIQEATERGDRRNEWLARVSEAELGSQLAPREWTRDRIEETAEGALRVFEGLADDLGLARAWGLTASCAWYQCRYDGAGRAHARAVEHACRTGDEQEELTARFALLDAVYFGSTHVSEVRRESERLLARVGESSGFGYHALLVLAGVEAMEGAAAESRTAFHRAKSIGEELRLAWAPAYTGLFADDVGVLTGDAEFAERELRAGYERLDAIGESGVRSTLAARLADALFELGRQLEAEHFADLSLEIASPDDVASQAWGRAVKAKLLAASGDYEAACRFAREAVHLAENTDDLFMHGQVLIALAEVLCMAGRETEAIPILQSAAEVSERKGNVVTAENARALLATLQAAPSTDARQ
jgi:class 3 adenylate cyclase/tetratricopeptide (TPR) repeat protein